MITSASEDKTAVITIAAASSIVINEQYETEKRGKRERVVAPLLFQENAFGFYDLLH